MTRSLTRSQALLLGLMLVGALVIGGWGLMTFTHRQAWSNDILEVTTAFRDVGGLQAGTRVHLQGVDVGEVKAVALPDVAGEPVQVHLRLAGHLRSRLGTDAQVKIARDNPLSDRVVRLLPGQPDSPRLHEGAALAPAEMPDLFDGLAQATAKLNSVLRELEGSVKNLRQGEQSFTADVTQSARKLNLVLGKLDRTLGQVEAGKGTLGKLLQDETLYEELTFALRELKAAAYDIRQGDGTLGQLVKDRAAYDQALNAVQDVRSMVVSVKQNSDALKSLPVVRSFVVDANKELVRPDKRRMRKVFAETELFEPGQAILTERGKGKVSAAAEWLKAYPAGEVVVAGLAPPTSNPDFALTLTQKQSEAVRDVLLQNSAHRTGWWWWNTRSIRALGCGNQPPAQPESLELPPARVEIVLFLPAE